MRKEIIKSQTSFQIFAKLQIQINKTQFLLPIIEKILIENLEVKKPKYVINRYTINNLIQQQF